MLAGLGGTRSGCRRCSNASPLAGSASRSAASRSSPMPGAGYTGEPLTHEEVLEAGPSRAPGWPGSSAGSSRISHYGHGERKIRACPGRHHAGGGRCHRQRCQQRPARVAVAWTARSIGSAAPPVMADLEDRYGSRPLLPDGQCRRQCRRAPAGAHRDPRRRAGLARRSAGEGESPRECLPERAGPRRRRMGRGASTFPAISTGIYSYPVDAGGSGRARDGRRLDRRAPRRRRSRDVRAVLRRHPRSLRAARAGRDDGPIGRSSCRRRTLNRTLLARQGLLERTPPAGASMSSSPSSVSRPRNRSTRTSGCGRRIEGFDPTS